MVTPAAEFVPPHGDFPRNYTRWTRQPGQQLLEADLVGLPFGIITDVRAGRVRVEGIRTEDLDLSPDAARMVGVRLIEAAALADGDRAIRERGA